MNFDKINSFIEKSISSAKSAFAKVPSILLYCAAIQRSGVSALLTTSNIISRLPEAGISNGVNADGTPNVTSQLVRIIVEEVYKELRDNCSKLEDLNKTLHENIAFSNSKLEETDNKLNKIIVEKETKDKSWANIAITLGIAFVIAFIAFICK